MLRKLLIVVCLLTTSLVFAQKGKKDKTDRALITQTSGYKEIGSGLPTIKFYRRDGVYLLNKDLTNGAPLIIMLFNPTCEHCEQQTALFEEYIDRFKNTNLVLVAAAGMGPYLQYFVNNTKADKYPALQISLDSSDYITKTFRYQSLPQLNIYDKNSKLVKVFSGTVPIDSLQAYIK